MKRLLLCMGLLIAVPFFTQPASAQKKPPASPPEVATGTIGGHTITIHYSSPRVRGREGHIFSSGGLISHDPHYPVWRAGANAATTLHTDANLKIGDLSVPKGEYTLFVNIANPDQWSLIVNKQTGQWGLKYDSSHDLGKTEMHMSKPSHMIEDLRWSITPEGGHKGKMTLEWENHIATVPVTVE